MDITNYPLVTRAGKGSRLTATDHDANMDSLEDAIRDTVGHGDNNGVTPSNVRVSGDTKSANYTCVAADIAKVIAFTAAAVCTIPSLGTGANFMVLNAAASGNVTVNGPGALDITLTPGQLCSTFEVNSKIYAIVGATQVIS